MKPEICNFFPIPDLFQHDYLLCIQPHPDDLEIGAGATIAKLNRTGVKTTWLTVTDGSAGTDDPSADPVSLARTRRKEAEKAAALLGTADLTWLDFADGGNLPYDKTRSGIAGIIRKLKPAAVLVCDPWLPYEAHTDHIRTGLATAEAAFLSHMPHFCPENLADGLEPHKVETVAFYYTAYPNTFIDVTNYWELKLAAIDCHATQFPPAKGKLLKDYLTAKARQQAKDHGCDLVEAIKVLSTNHLHIFENAWQC